MLVDNKTEKLTMREIIIRGSIIAIVVTIPSITAFLISWQILDNLLQSAIIGAVVHFVAMGFSLKISKRLLVKKSN